MELSWMERFKGEWTKRGFRTLTNASAEVSLTRTAASWMFTEQRDKKALRPLPEHGRTPHRTSLQVWATGDYDISNSILCHLSLNLPSTLARVLLVCAALTLCLNSTVSCCD
ncbi:hypothetical protein MHYP_G00022230 [Metynnis hypsauchen]